MSELRDTLKDGVSEQGDESFFSRWSRRKQQARDGIVPPETPPMRSGDAASTAATVDSAPATLPSLGSLNFESDYSAFMGTCVAAPLRRAALSRLFADPHFNQMDGLDVYIDDYNAIANLSAGEVGLLAHARRLLGTAPEPAPQAQTETTPPQDASADDGESTP